MPAGDATVGPVRYWGLIPQEGAGELGRRRDGLDHIQQHPVGGLHDEVALAEVLIAQRLNRGEAQVGGEIGVHRIHIVHLQVDDHPLRYAAEACGNGGVAVVQDCQLEGTQSQADVPVGTEDGLAAQGLAVEGRRTSHIG